MIVSVLITGCIKAPGEPTPLNDQETDSTTKESVDIEKQEPKVIKKTVKVKEVEIPEEPDIETIVIEGDIETLESEIPMPECDGRLLPTYNFRNEITGYRCVEDADNFECPGHRAGETWEENGAECECKANGEIVCTS